MAYASWLNISTANGGAAVVFRVWDAVTRLLAGDMAAKWTVLDVSAAGWTDESSPANGAWVLLQCETPNADASKMQVFIGHTTSSVALAGFGTKAAGLYMAVSPNGGWDETNHWFGASLADWRNGSIKSVGYFNSASVLGLILTSGTTNRPGGVWVHVRQGSGNARVLAGRMLVPPDGGAAAQSRCCISFVSAMVAGDASLLGAANGLVEKTSLDGWDTSALAVPDVAGNYATPCFGVDAESSAPVGTVTPVYDTVTAKFRGYDEVAQRILAADGDLNGAIGAATRWVYGGFSWLREPTRDGSWV